MHTTPSVTLSPIKFMQMLSKILSFLPPLKRNADVDLPVPARSKEEYLSGFKGSHVIIPDLYALLPGWKFAVNSKYDVVKERLGTWMNSWVDNPETCRRMQLADFAMLAGCFYPEAQEEEYLMAAYYHLWVFVWDDELDCGPLTNDLEKVRQFKQETDDCLEYTLGPEPFSGPRPSMGPIVGAFYEIAEKVAAGSTAEAHAFMLRELLAYVDGACALPFERNLEGQKELFTREKFQAQRVRSGGCGPSLSLLLYLHHLDIPSSLIDHESVQVVFTQAALIVHLTNDIVSFVKELRDDQLDNIVPVLAIENNIPLQEAIERACDLVRAARQTLEEAETRLPLPTGDDKLDKQILRFVQGCKDVAAGNLNWSYRNARYFGRNPRRDGNRIFLQI
ncbi:hypothetical protein SCP_1503070 [Sparassis crispa]|uniref:Terpene synthase n=1 Tax=Sparassis crispa TaxID=139825 RepID=A0A401H4J1_9APHY|nr:hypothetical protein SCP_1503070 [Sparassis crispa]GBE89299.1 hypothetical protein SCP_1503070 [Sparassis crispa]